MISHRGHCRCEGVVISVQAEPEISVYCHCDDCCRSSGAPVIASVGMPRHSIVWEANESLAEFKKGTCTRTFCNQCGTPVAQEHESAPNHIFFYTALMDDPENFPPTYHSFEGQQLDWLTLSDDLERYETTKMIKVQA